MNEQDGTERLSPAEERLVRVMAILRAEAEAADGPIRRAVMSRLRLQLLARTLTRAIGGIAGALADGLALVLRMPPERKERS